MKPHYILFLLGILTVSGCEKRDPEPEPELIGKWEEVHFQKNLHNRAGMYGQIQTVYGPIERPQPAGSVQMVVTADSMNIQGDLFLIRQGYTRQGKSINVVTRTTPTFVLYYSGEIEELTEHRLVFHLDTFFPPNQGNTLLDTRTTYVYSR